MGYVYRYTDLVDGIIKYVGIVWSNNRTLKQRICEHEKNDDWCKIRKWKIEYILENIDNRSEAEAFESHYVSLYKTDKYFNIKKSGWGINKFLPNEDNWNEFVDTKIEKYKTDIILKNKIEKLIFSIKNKEKLILEQDEIIVKNSKLIKGETEIIVSGSKISIPVQNILDRLEKKMAVYHDFQFGITSLISVNKWADRESGIRVAMSIIEDAINEKCLQNVTLINE